MNIFKNIPARLWVLIGAFILIGLLSWLRVFDTSELITYDLRCQLRTLIKPPRMDKRIVIVEIGDDTLKNFGTWPLQRDFHGSLVDVLSQYGAKAIVFDILFSDEPESFNQKPEFEQDRKRIGKEDEVFIEAVKKAGNVYFPVVMSDDWTKTAAPFESADITADLLAPYKEAAKGYGHINVIVDPDGKKRRTPPFIKYKKELIPQLALKAAADTAGLDIKNARFSKNKIVLGQKFSIPLDRNGFFMANYPAVWAQAFHHVSYYEVLASYLFTSQGKAEKAKLNPADFKDSICFVGLTATATHDYHPTPLEKTMPMVGMLASISNSILTKQFIYDAGPLANTLVNLLVFAGIILLSFRNELWRSLLNAIGFAIVYFLIALNLFIFFGIWIDLLLPLLIIACGWVGFTVYKFLEQARKRALLEKELDIARQIQQSFLPSEVKSLANLEISSFLRSAKFVGGDLYDIIQLDEKRVGVFIGDVSGKGVPAALIMAQTISLLRVFAKAQQDPAVVLKELNSQLAPVLAGRFVTALYIIFDMRNGTLSASCAGHNPIMVYDAQKDAVEEFLPASGLPLGVMADSPYEKFERQLHKGDTFLLYTDGASEARDKKEQEFGEERIKTILFEQKYSSGKQIVERLEKAVSQFSKGLPQFDDITLIALNVR